MKGTNPRLPAVDGDGSLLYVREIFSTIQGEGPRAGEPAIFVRLGGCNLACWFCDTDFDMQKSPAMSLKDVLAQIEAAGDAELVVITGGEPARQPIYQLCLSLFERYRDPQIETSGSLECNVPKLTEVVCSPKTPKLHPSFNNATAWKYVLSAGHGMIDKADGLPIGNYQSKTGAHAKLARPTNDAPVYVMPMDEGNVCLNANNTALCAAIAVRHGYRLSLQLHKIAGLR